MGQRAGLTAWAVRLAFVVLIAGAATLRIGGAAQAGQEGLLEPTRTVLRAAGYSVGPPKRRTFLNGEIQTYYYLVATHPGCAGALTVRPMRIADKPEPGSADPRAAPIYAFGSWLGARESRPRILLEALRLQVLSIIRLGRGVRPIPAVLIVTDPSACAAIATPQWKRVWID